MGFLSNLATYAGKWERVASEKLSKEEIKSVKEATVVESQYGLSVAMVMVSGGTKYLPLSNTCDAEVGDEVDLKNMEIVRLHRDGENDIFRAEF